MNFSPLSLYSSITGQYQKVPEIQRVWIEDFDGSLIPEEEYNTREDATVVPLKKAG